MRSYILYIWYIFRFAGSLFVAIIAILFRFRHDIYGTIYFLKYNEVEASIFCLPFIYFLWIAFRLRFKRFIYHNENWFIKRMDGVIETFTAEGKKTSFSSYLLLIYSLANYNFYRVERRIMLYVVTKEYLIDSIFRNQNRPTLWLLQFNVDNVFVSISNKCV